jgi:hypothetical protein
VTEVIVTKYYLACLSQASYLARGGYRAWEAAGLPVSRPTASLQAE